MSKTPPTDNNVRRPSFDRYDDVPVDGPVTDHGSGGEGPDGPNRSTTNNSGDARYWDVDYGSGGSATSVLF